MSKLDIIDMHSHILPNIDDGAVDLEQSKQLIQEAKNAGIVKIISTSHYMEPNYIATKTKREELIKNLNNDFEIYNGCELYFNLDFENKLQNIPTLNNSRYILVEFPLNIKPQNFMDFIFLLFENDLVPIIAHPERYRYINDFTFYKTLKQNGCLFQINFASFISYYGSKEKLKANYLMKNGVVDFLGSDVHRPKTIYPRLKDILDKLVQNYGISYVNKLIYDNPIKVLENEEIQTNMNLNKDFNILEKQILKLK